MSKPVGIGPKRVEPIEMFGFPMYKCAMCENHSQSIAHIENHMKWFECVWDEVNIDQMMGSQTYSLITINNVTKPYICHGCVMMESGMDENDMEVSK